MDSLHAEAATGNGRTTDAAREAHEAALRAGADFLRRRWGAAPPGLYVLVWTKAGQRKRSGWISVGALQEAEATLAPFYAADAGDIWAGVGLSPADNGPHKRCDADQIAGVAGLWADIDIRGEAHKQGELPATVEEALSLAGSLGVEPTEVVHSGHGLQPWWLFAEPWIFRDDADREHAADLARRFHALLSARAKDRGWKLDSTYDLSRILRLPGTRNHKLGPPAPVTLLRAGGPRYDPGELLALVGPAEEPSAGGAWTQTAHAGADPVRRARAYVERMPAAIAGQAGHRATFAAALVLVRGFSLSPAEARPILNEYSARCVPPWSEKELDHKLRQAVDKGRLPFGYLLNRPGPAPGGDAYASRNGQSGDAPPPPDEIPCGPLALRPGRPRRSPSGKLAVPVRVYRGGSPVDQVDVTSSANGRAAAARLLRERGGGTVTAEAAAHAVDAVIAWGLRQLDRPAGAAAEGDTLRAVLGRYVSERFAPTRREGRRVWLNTLGEYFDRPAFAHLLSEDMLAAARAAADVDDGEDRYTLMAKVDAELRVIFGGLLATLPDRRPDDAPVHRGEREGLAAAVVGMWSAVRSLTKTKTKDGEEKTHNTSLVEQAKVMVRDGKVPAGYWHKIHPGHAAFITIRERAEGGDVADAEILLAMNAELAVSVGARLPDGINGFNLKKAGKKAGLFRDLGDVPDKAERGGTRVIVLSREMTDYLLEDIEGKTVGQENCHPGEGTVSGGGGEFPPG
jgi:hypothetical protein